MLTSPRRIPALVAAATAVAAAAAAVASATSGTITITTPKTGSSISLHANPYTAVAGNVSFAAAGAQTTRFFLRRDGCGTSNDNPHLSVTSGTDAGDGCGLILNAVGPVGDVDQASFIDFPASDGMPLAFGGTRAITGQIALTGAQVGLAEVDVTLEALVGGNAITLGSTTASAVLDPTGNDTPVPFTISPSTSLDGSDVQALDLRVHVHGPNVYSGFVSLNGNSYVDLPSYTASVNRSVSVSVDDPTFASPVRARLASSGSTWSVAIPTPAVGKHTIYARSTQGYTVSPATSTTFSVKR
jgi:hypothetical protein